MAESSYRYHNNCTIFLQSYVVFLCGVLEEELREANATVADVELEGRVGRVGQDATKDLIAWSRRLFFSHP